MQQLIKTRFNFNIPKHTMTFFKWKRPFSNVNLLLHWLIGIWEFRLLPTMHNLIIHNPFFTACYYPLWKWIYTVVLQQKKRSTNSVNKFLSVNLYGTNCNLTLSPWHCSLFGSKNFCYFPNWAVPITISNTLKINLTQKNQRTFGTAQ